MGLMETLTGLFKSSGLQDQLIKSVSGMISDGSISLEKFKQGADKAGLSDIFDSWVSPGENKPISADQLKQAADPANLQKIANDAGMTVDEAAEELSKALPDVVNTLTPDGVLPSDQQIQSALGT
jgi:uncharacterized protein YidB (DUF937 family)